MQLKTLNKKRILYSTIFFSSEEIPRIETEEIGEIVQEIEIETIEMEDRYIININILFHPPRGPCGVQYINLSLTLTYIKREK
jgi:hypothetical protein